MKLVAVISAIILVAFVTTFNYGGCGGSSSSGSGAHGPGSGYYT